MYTNIDNGKMKYCSLALCGLLNNAITVQDLSKNDMEIEVGIGDVLRECGLKQETDVIILKESLRALEGTYLVIEDSVYKVIHDKLFDFVAKYFGEKMLQIFIDNATTSFIRERFPWRSATNMDADIGFAIPISDAHVDRYTSERLWNGFVDNTFLNRNMSYPAFTERFINNLNKLDWSKQIKLACKQDIKNEHRALRSSCLMGSVDIVKWIISKNSDINYLGKDGYFHLLLANQQGQVHVVKELLQQSESRNATIGIDNEVVCQNAMNGRS